MASRIFTAGAQGFRINHLYRYPVSVELQPWLFVVSNDAQPPQQCSLYDGPRLTALIARSLLGVDAPPVDTANVLAKRATQVEHKIQADVYAQRWRLLANVDPLVHQIHYRVGRIAGRVSPLAGSGAFYENRYLVRDVLNYRAAAIAFAYLDSELSRRWFDTRPSNVGSFSPWERVRVKACNAPASDLPAAVQQPQGGPPALDSVEAQLAAMSQWRGLFSPTGAPYRSLNRTLMNLPEEVPPDLVCQLNRIRLERPITNRLELTMLLLRASAPEDANPEAAQSQLRIFHHATAGEIECAIRRIAAATDRQLSSRRLEDLRFVIKYLGDYPEPHGGNLSGLAEQALRWHHHAHERRARERVVANLGGEAKPTARPPIPLPKILGVTFLSTVGAIVAEGARMKHCIATRAADAVKGRCFLFHIDFRGERASVEVSAAGEVVDAEGPGNTDNEAARWGALRLRRWAAGLRRPRCGARPRKPRAARNAEQRAQPRQMELPF